MYIYVASQIKTTFLPFFRRRGDHQKTSKKAKFFFFFKNWDINPKSTPDNHIIVIFIYFKIHLYSIFKKIAKIKQFYLFIKYYSITGTINAHLASYALLAKYALLSNLLLPYDSHIAN